MFTINHRTLNYPCVSHWGAVTVRATRWSQRSQTYSPHCLIIADHTGGGVKRLCRVAPTVINARWLDSAVLQPHHGFYFSLCEITVGHVTHCQLQQGFSDASVNPGATHTHTKKTDDVMRFFRRLHTFTCTLMPAWGVRSLFFFIAFPITWPSPVSTFNYKDAEWTWADEIRVCLIIYSSLKVCVEKQYHSTAVSVFHSPAPSTL